MRPIFTPTWLIYRFYKCFECGARWNPRPRRPPCMIMMMMSRVFFFNTRSSFTVYRLKNGFAKSQEWNDYNYIFLHRKRKLGSIILRCKEKSVPSRFLEFQNGDANIIRHFQSDDVVPVPGLVLFSVLAFILKNKLWRFSSYSFLVRYDM